MFEDGKQHIILVWDNDYPEDWVITYANSTNE